jgi:hypothetical protein
MGSALQQAVALEGKQVVMHGARRSEIDCVGDLADRWRIASLLDRARDAVENSLASLRVVSCQIALCAPRADQCVRSP